MASTTITNIITNIITLTIAITIAITIAVVTTIAVATTIAAFTIAVAITITHYATTMAPSTSRTPGDRLGASRGTPTLPTTPADAMATAVDAIKTPAGTTQAGSTAAAAIVTAAAAIVTAAAAMAAATEAITTRTDTAVRCTCCNRSAPGLPAASRSCYAYVTPSDTLPTRRVGWPDTWYDIRVVGAGMIPTLIILLVVAGATMSPESLEFVVRVATAVTKAVLLVVLGAACQANSMPMDLLSEAVKRINQLEGNREYGVEGEEGQHAGASNALQGLPR
ncbi:hypothetical protein DL765_005147 [Monosporascus sp. GIB2]|nr:hypothetical protein DL765_005147 [Monosporascus sp. GIB2]